MPLHSYKNSGLTYSLTEQPAFRELLVDLLRKDDVPVLVVAVDVLVRVFDFVRVVRHSIIINQQQVLAN